MKKLLLTFIVVLSVVSIGFLGGIEVRAGHCDANDPACHNAGAASQNVYSSSGAPSAGFVPLTNLPGVDGSHRSLADYLNALFRLLIGVGALFAVVRITLAGIKYMTTEAFGTKGEAKEDIKEALFGLLILLSVVIVLQIINPDILKLDVLNDAPSLTYNPNTQPMSPGYDRDEDRWLTPQQLAFEEKRCRDGGGRPAYTASCRYSPFVSILKDDLTPQQQQQCVQDDNDYSSFKCEEYDIGPGNFDVISAAEIDAGLNVEKLNEQCVEKGGVGGALRKVDENTFHYHCYANAYAQAVDNGLVLSQRDADILTENNIPPEKLLNSIGTDEMLQDPNKVPVFEDTCAQEGGYVFKSTPDAVYCVAQ